MEITDTLASSLSPVISTLNNSNAVVRKPLDKTSDASVQEKTSARFSDSQKQDAQRRLDEISSRDAVPLSRDRPGFKQAQALQAYQQTEQDPQKDYLSDILGIDVKA